MTQIPHIALPTQVDWPRDEAAHEGLPWEIWWISTVLSAGERNIATHALINHMAGGALYIIATITDLDREEERTQTFYAEPGSAPPAMDSLRIETDLCCFAGSFEDGYRFRANMGDGAGFDLFLKPTRPVLHNGGAGQYQFQGTTTTQYSIGFLETSGTVRLDGQELAATGRGWHDRQWDNAPRSNELGFTWFGICLDNGDTVSFFDTGARTDGGHSWVTIARPDATHIVTAAKATPAETYRTGVGRPVPRCWTLEIPALHARLDLGQRLLSDGQSLYTGVLDVKGAYDGEPLSGYGFCDIVGSLPSA